MDQIISAIARHFCIEDVYTTGFTHLIQSINEKDAELAQLLSASKQAQEAYDFLNKDYELRHKMPDIWKMHCDNAKEKMKTQKQLLIEKLQQMKISTAID
jgi:hypothetical protein